MRIQDKMDGTNGKVVRLAAAQPLSAKARRMIKFKDNPEGRRQHFLKYNIGASTYDEAYAREYGEEYLGYLEEWVKKVADRRVELVLFPEFCFVPGILATPAKGNPSNPKAFEDALRLYAWSGSLFSRWMQQMSCEAGLFIGAATLTSRGGRIYNTGFLTDDHGKVVLSYDKIHLPPDEAEHVTAGCRYEVVETRLGRIGFAICYDVQFPEAAAALAVREAQLILHPSAGYSLPDETPDMGRNRLRVRASDHYVPWVYSSFSPTESGGPGRSTVIAANGDVLASVAGKRCGMALGETVVGGKRQWPSDQAEAPDREKVRRKWRRPETYRLLAEKQVRGTAR
jgi:predicted amidohydrolase